MSFPRTPEKTVSHLLVLLDKVTQNGRGKKPVDPTYEEIKTWFEEKKDWFSKLKHLDDELMGKIAELEEGIDNATYDGDKPDAEEEPKQGINNATSNSGKRNAIKKCFQSIQDVISRIQLDRYEVPQPKKEEAQFERRKLSDDWLALGIEESILESPTMATLKISYTILDIQHKMCLLCFAIFPVEAIIKKRPLIYWWIGEGFVRKTKEKTAEEMGEEVLQKLIDMSLIYPEYGKREYKNPRYTTAECRKSPFVNCYRMHPWIRRMVITVAKNAEFFDLDRKGAPKADSFQSRRMCIRKNDQEETPNKKEKDDQEVTPNKKELEELPLTTLFNLDQKYLDINEEWFSKLHRLVVLQLGSWWWQNSVNHELSVKSKRFLNHLGALTKLKYISLQGIAGIEELPSSVLDLSQLVILDLKACHSLERLPPDISRLTKLACLDISDCIFLEKMPSGLDKLPSLRVLKGLKIGSSTNSNNPLYLSQMKKLRKLGIYMPEDGRLEEQEQLGELKDMEDLRVLTITWKEVAGVKEKDSSRSNEEHTQKAVKSFSFPSKLEKLDLRCIPFKEQPEWLKPNLLSSLKSLYIRGGKLDGLASKADQKWKVEILRLRYLYDFAVDIQTLKKDFPHMKYVEKIKCRKGENERNADDEVWGTEYYEEDERRGENKANETKQADPVQNEDSEEEEKEEITIEKSREPVKGDNNQVPNKVEDQKASSSKNGQGTREIVKKN